MLDTRDLKGYERVPAVNNWIEHTLFPGAVRVRLGGMGTQSRLLQGGRAVDSICKCGRNLPMIVPHIVQACGIVSGLQTKRHDNVVLLMAQSLLKRAGRGGTPVPCRITQELP